MADLAAVAIRKARLESALVERSDWIERLASTDALTGIANRATLERMLELVPTNLAQTVDTIRVTVQSTPPAPAAGQTLDGTGFVLCAGAQLPRNGSGGAAQFADGDTPGWKWAGSANGSTSSVTGWRVERLDWYYDRLEFFIDGVKAWVADRTLYAAAGIEWPYDTEYHNLLLQLAIGGAFPGDVPVPVTSWSKPTAAMQVDYVRVVAL